MPRPTRDGLTLAACTFCPGMMLGVMLAFPIWVPAWTRDFGAGRGAIMMIYAVSGLLMTATMAVVGRLLIRIPAWRLVAAGSLLIGIGLAVASRITGFYAFAVVYGITIGVGVGLSSVLPCQYLAVRLFPSRMGAIAGLITLAMAAAGVVFPLVETPLLAAIGWPSALAATGLVAMALGLLMSLTLMRTARVEAPTVVGAAGPHGAHAPVPQAPVPHGDDRMAVVRPLRTGEILRTASFWIIVVATMPLLGTPTAVQTNFLPILKDHGIDAHTAALMLAVLALGTATGALSFGWLADRIHPRVLTLSIALVMSASLLAFTRSGALPVAALAAFLLGTGSGGTLALSSILALRQFGAGYAPVFGLVQVFILPYMFAPPAVGWVRDHVGSYTPALLALIPITVLCAATTWWLGPPAATGRPVAARAPAA